MNSSYEENSGETVFKPNKISPDSVRHAPRASYSLGTIKSSLDKPEGEVTHQLSSDGSTVTLRIAGRFDFSLHDSFRRAYRNTWRFGIRYVLDLRATTCVDSSALGMLLLMREYIGSSSEPVRILGCSKEIEKAFLRARFEQFFRFR